jgi:hypothetical protein
MVFRPLVAGGAESPQPNQYWQVSTSTWLPDRRHDRPARPLSAGPDPTDETDAIHKQRNPVASILEANGGLTFGQMRQAMSFPDLRGASVVGEAWCWS